MVNLYLDCEWFLNQKIFLVGYAYSISEHGQLYESTLTVDHLEKIVNYQKSIPENFMKSVPHKSNYFF